MDWLRGIAALWVLSYHADLITQSPKYFGNPSLGHVAEVGHRGVELFFVISGFVMAATVPKDARNEWRGLRGYAVRRLFRIFPAYLAIFAPLALLGLVTGLGAPETGTIASNFVRNVLLLPRDDLTTYVPVVAWTLTHELMFYAIFATAYIRRSLALLLLTAWVTTALAVHAKGAVPDGWQMQLSLLNLYFVVGVAAEHMRRLKSIPLAMLVICAVGATSLAILLDYESGPIVKVDISVRTVLYMIGFGALVLSASKLTPAFPRAWHMPFRLLGQQSYGIYLSHYPILVAVALVLAPLKLNAAVSLLFAAFLAIGASRAIYFLVERPGVRLGRRMGSSAPS